MSSDSERPRRRYCLTPDGLDSLRASIARVRPWIYSTGPRTPEGKARSKVNAWKHGERSAEAVARRRDLAGLLREARACIAEESAELRRLNRLIRSGAGLGRDPQARHIVLRLEFD